MHNDGGNDVRNAGTQPRAFWKAEMEKMTGWPRLSAEVQDQVLSKSFRYAS